MTFGSHSPVMLSHQRSLWNIARQITGVLLLIAIAVIHLAIVPVGLHLATYLGVLFVIDCVGAVVAAGWIAWSDDRVGWTIGDVIAGGSLLGYVFSRTFGLPALHRLPWQSPNGLLSLVLEAIVVVLALTVLVPFSSPALRR